MGTSLTCAVTCHSARLTTEAQSQWKTAQYLPLRGSLQTIINALEEQRTALITAPPGTGKTVLTPLAIAANWDKLHLLVIILVIPQRVTVVNMAAYIEALIEDEYSTKIIDTAYGAFDGNRSTGVTDKRLLFCTPEACRRVLASAA